MELLQHSLFLCGFLGRPLPGPGTANLAEVEVKVGGDTRKEYQGKWNFFITFTF